MPERIYVRGPDGKLTEKPGPRDPSKLYSGIGLAPDGANCIREWSAEEQAARVQEEARSRIPPPPTDDEVFWEALRSKLTPEDLASAKARLSRGQAVK